jgi:hypothetical protein
MSKNAEKIKNPKISSCDKTYLYIKLTLSRSEIHIFFYFSIRDFFPNFTQFFPSQNHPLSISPQKFNNSIPKISPNPNPPHLNPTQLPKPTQLLTLIIFPTPLPTTQNQHPYFPISLNPNPSRPPHPPNSHHF